MKFETEPIKNQEEKEPQQKEYERMDDEEAERIIDEKIDISDLVFRLETIFSEPDEVVKALARLVLELKDELPDYDTILSDESSGRESSLFLNNIIKKVREREEKENPNVYFISAGKHRQPEIQKAIEEFLKSKKDKIGKTLLVTEYIESGQSIKKIAEILEKQKNELT